MNRARTGIDAGAASRPIGVLLAAGRGRRMGTLKQLLPWGSEANAKPLVAAAFDGLAPACRRMVVVIGEGHDAVIESLRPREFGFIRVDSDAEMFESVRAGLAEAARTSPGADVLLHPADQPVIEAATLDAVLEAARTFPGCAIMPEYRGQGGHPVFIPGGMIPAIVAWQGEGGLRGFWQDHADLRRRLPVDDPSAVLDIDTPEDHEKGRSAVSTSTLHSSP